MLSCKLWRALNSRAQHFSLMRSQRFVPVSKTHVAQQRCLWHAPKTAASLRISYHQHCLNPSSVLQYSSTSHGNKTQVTTKDTLENSATNRDNVIKLLTKLHNAEAGYEIIQGLAMLNKIIVDEKINFRIEFHNTPEMKEVYRKIEDSRFSGYWTSTCMRHLLQLGCIDDQTDLLYSLQQGLRWSISRESISLLLNVLDLQVNNTSLPDQPRVLKECIETLEMRWVEVNQPHEIALAYTHHKLFTPEFLQKLDTAVTQRCDDWEIQQQCRMISTLSSIQRRATAALRALSFHASKKRDVVPPKLIVSTLLACNNLSFHDNVLLFKLKKDILEGISDISKPKLISNILYSMGQMRWSDWEVMDACAEWMLKNISICEPYDLVTLIITAATVNYEPVCFHEIFQKEFHKVSLESVGKNNIWLDVVWSLVVLDKASQQHLDTVLNDKFKKELTESSSPMSSIKLKQIEAICLAKKNATSTSSLLSIASTNEVVTKQECGKSPVAQKVFENLIHLFPPTQFLREKVQTDFGSIVLAEFVANNEGKALPLSSLNDEKVLNKHPMVCIVWEYKDYCLSLSGPQLTGANALLLRWLRLKKYKVLEVPHFEYNLRSGTLKNVKSLQTKIESLLSST